ncbi:VOC family protein, partial [Mycobacterium kansasii]
DATFSTPRGSGSVYVVVTDPDAVYARAQELGARLVREMREEDYGSKGFSVADPEGNTWSFGTYAG